MARLAKIQPGDVIVDPMVASGMILSGSHDIRDTKLLARNVSELSKWLLFWR